MMELFNLNIFVPLTEQTYAVQNPTMRCEEIFREKIQKLCGVKYFRVDFIPVVWERLCFRCFIS